MNDPGTPRAANSQWGKLGLAAGAAAVLLLLPLFGIEVPTLPALHQYCLLGVFVLSMAACSLVGSRRPLWGLLLLPACFFGIACLACWWIVAR